MNADERRFFLVYLRHLRLSAASALRKNDSRCRTGLSKPNAVAESRERTHSGAPFQPSRPLSIETRSAQMNANERRFFLVYLRHLRPSAASALQKERFAMPDRAIEAECGCRFAMPNRAIEAECGRRERTPSQNLFGPLHHQTHSF